LLAVDVAAKFEGIELEVSWVGLGVGGDVIWVGFEVQGAVGVDLFYFVEQVLMRRGLVGEKRGNR
jgi:hypothetical protein